MPRLVDLRHTIRAGMMTYPGFPVSEIRPFLTREDSKAHYAAGTELAMDDITMIGNTGTSIDGPFHRYEGGMDLAGLDLDTLVNQPAEIFHLRDVSTRGISASAFAHRAPSGKGVLLDTGWSRLFGMPGYAARSVSHGGGSGVSRASGCHPGRNGLAEHR